MLGSATIFDRPSFVSDCEQVQTWDFVYSINPEHGETSPESGDRLAVLDVVGLGIGVRSPIIATLTAVTVKCVRYNRTREVIMCPRSLFGRFSLGF